MGCHPSQLTHIVHRGRYTTNQLQEPEFRLRLQSLYIVYTAPRKRETLNPPVHGDSSLGYGDGMEYNRL